MEEIKYFEERVSFRLFNPIRNRLLLVLKHARDITGERKYDNESHIYRVAVMQFLNNEEKQLKIKKGRPKKYTNHD